MDDISQTVVHLSKNMMSSLSNSVRRESGDGTTCTSSVDSANFDGLHNPAIFFQKLFGRQRNREIDEQLHLQLLARIRLPFARLNFPRHERMTVKSRRVVDVDEREGSTAERTNSNFRATEKTNPDSSSMNVRHTFESIRVYASEKSEVNSAVSKEELGRATWTLLHTLAAQFPDHPSKQQQSDVKDLMTILSRIYPCKDCADHFKQVLKANPVEAKSRDALAQWMCRVHNVVNRSIGKPQFPCNDVNLNLRWGALKCEEGACDLHGRFYK